MKSIKIWKASILAISFVIITANTIAQIGIGTITPNSSSILDITATNKGLLIPRLTDAQRSAINFPASGLLVYQTDGQVGFYYNSGTPGIPQWEMIATSSNANLTSWNLTGNTGNIPSNFIGTTDGQNLSFRTNNIPRLTFAQIHGIYFPATTNNNSIVGNLSYLPNNITGQYNTLLGSGAGFSSTSGNLNTAVGFASLFNNSTGNNNTALGEEALTTNSTGNSNIGIGSQALRGNTTGYSNIAIGSGALTSTSTMNNTIAIGDSALYNYTFSNIGGNLAIGSKALFSTTIGSSNTAIGYRAMYLNSGKSQNTALGFESLFNNNGDYNVAIGYNSLYSNTTGNYNTAIGTYSMSNGANTNTGSYNTAVGYTSLSQNSTGSYNTALGHFAMWNNTTGNNNVGLGYGALQNISTGTGNTAVGERSMQANITGSYNTALGDQANIFADGYSNTVAIGYSALSGVSNTITLGNSSVTTLRCNTQTITSLSDERFKNNIQPEIHGLDFIMKLQPITYHLNVQKLNNFIYGNKSDSLFAGEFWNKSIQSKESILYSGFSAQQVEQATKSIGYDFSGLVRPMYEKDTYSLSYSEFVVPLVKAVQEQQVLIENLQKEINALKSIIANKQ